MESVTRAQIWAKLSKIDNKGLATDKFNGVKFVNWMACHATMMDNFPEYRWEFIEDTEGRDAHYYPDGTAEVRCIMTIGDHTNITTLPVYNNLKAIQNPNSFQINTAKQRCRVKAMAEFGLFHHLWSKLAVEEELEEEEAPEEKKGDRKPPGKTTGKAKEDLEESEITIDMVWQELKPEMLLAKSKAEANAKFAQFETAIVNRMGRAMTETEQKDWRNTYSAHLNSHRTNNKKKS